MSNKLYRIRNRNQKIEGPNSEAEVLAGIRSGRFNGDDGICQEGSFGPWVKLSSHPKFYDEFLRKLFEAKYEVSQYTDPSQTKTPVRPPDSAQTLSVDQAHVGVEKVLTEIPSGGAESPPDEVARRAGLTIHQSEIDLLFSKSKRIKETTVAALSPQAVVPGADLLPAAGQESAAPKRTIQLRRVGLLAVIVLTALYFLGSPSKHPRISSENLGDQVSQNKTFESQSAEINRYATLLLEADELARQDIPIFLASAEEHLRAAIAFDEKTVDAFVKLALVLTRQYHYASADRRPEIGERLKEILRRGREIEPQKEVFYVAEGEHALTDGDIALAKQSLSYAHETNPQSFVVEQLAIAVELAEGASEGLLERMKKLAPPAPFRSRVSYWLAATERRLGKLAEARKTLLEALQENPVHAPSYLLLGEVFSAQNDLGDARNAFETAGRLARLDGFRSAAGAYLRLGDVEQSLGKAESAIRSYRLARYFGASDVEVKKRSPSFSYDRKSVLAEAGKEPYEARYFADQARVLFSERNYPAAVLFYRVAAHLDGKTTEYQVKLGEATELMATTVGQFLRARFLYLKALEAAPESVGALVHLGSLETDFYRFDQGYEALRQAAALRPEAVEPMIALGKHFFRRQDYQASLEQFLRAKKIAPLDPEVPYYAGLLILKFSKEQAREAMALFYRSYTLDPQNYAALAEWLKLKVTYYEKNFAIKFVNALIQQNPNNANYLWALGQIYEANGEANRAIRYYHQALDIDNRNGKVRMSLAKVLRTVGE
ncbi:MAG: tetratricopeptide repeat protein, partial [Deltaproteobacteria bacterium]|nr:tetratricopeptide repeat protein [Deltaproteobacteria bacterium]